MSYLNSLDINGEIYYLGNLTDGENIVSLPRLSGDDTFALVGDIIDNLNSNYSSKPLSANQGRVLAEMIAELRNYIDEKLAELNS